jgi:hypothetical protein
MPKEHYRRHNTLDAYWFSTLVGFSFTVLTAATSSTPGITAGFPKVMIVDRS